MGTLKNAREVFFLHALYLTNNTPRSHVHSAVILYTSVSDTAELQLNKNGPRISFIYDPTIATIPSLALPTHKPLLAYYLFQSNMILLTQLAHPCEARKSHEHGSSLLKT